MPNAFTGAQPHSLCRALPRSLLHQALAADSDPGSLARPQQRLPSSDRLAAPPRASAIITASQERVHRLLGKCATRSIVLRAQALICSASLSFNVEFPTKRQTTEKRFSSREFSEFKRLYCRFYLLEWLNCQIKSQSFRFSSE